jgi:hypothetical protein
VVLLDVDAMMVCIVFSLERVYEMNISFLVRRERDHFWRERIERIRILYLLTIPGQ